MGWKIYFSNHTFSFLDLLGDSPHEIDRRSMNGSAFSHLHGRLFLLFYWATAHSEKKSSIFS